MSLSYEVGGHLGQRQTDLGGPDQKLKFINIISD